MLLVERDAQDRLVGAMEVWLVNQHGQMVADSSVMMVNQLELTPGYAAKAVIQRFVIRLARLFPNVQKIYWQRLDKPGAPIHSYDRQQWVKEEVLV